MTGQVQADSGRMADLGTAEPVFEQLSYGPDQPREFDSQVRWRLSSAGVERLEQIRAGGGFVMSVGVRYGLLGGIGAPDWREPHRPVRVPYPDQPVQIIIKAHDWVQNVLEPIQQESWTWEEEAAWYWLRPVSAHIQHIQASPAPQERG